MIHEFIDRIEVHEADKIEHAEAESISKLEHEISVKTEARKSAKQSVVELEHHIKDLAEIIKYAEQYRTNRSYHIGYKKAKNPAPTDSMIYMKYCMILLYNIFYYRIKESNLFYAYIH